MWACGTMSGVYGSHKKGSGSRRDGDWGRNEDEDTSANGTSDSQLDSTWAIDFSEVTWPSLVLCMGK